MVAIQLAEHGFVPDRIIRIGIRRLLARRLKQLALADPADRARAVSSFVDELSVGPVAIATGTTNEQHYEVPASFFQDVLGPHLKYSSCLFDGETDSLGAAEETMLAETCERAQLEDNLSILELGCGWGSLSLWMAEHFPNSQITAVSNSVGQRIFIENQMRARGLNNLQIVTADMRQFDTDQHFDRIVSIEMFEHMRNYRVLFERLSNWLHEDGMAFLHVFCHRDTPYLFETEGAANWMGRHFFTGGTMPSEELFSHFDEHLEITQQWRVSGLHYWKTCEAWLQNLDAHRGKILASFASDLGPKQAKIQLQRWRMFFMACAELFRFNGGEEWFVGHYLFQHRPVESASSKPELVESC